MAIPPTMFPTVAESLASVGLNERGRIVVEKPFGRDLAVGARAQRHAARGVPRGAHLPHRPLPRQGERRGPAGVPLLQHAARAGVEPQLRAQRADHDGGDDRRRGPGQLLRRRRRDPRRGAEPPAAGRRAAGDGAAGRARRRATCRTRRPRCSRRCEPIDPTTLVRGQYVGYRDEPGVAPGLARPRRSSPPRLEIDSWRWAGVPWYVRAGKALAAAATEAVVEFREPPRLLFDEAGGPPPDRNLVRFRLGKQRRRHVHAAGQDARASTSTARTSTSPSTSPPRSASATRPTSGCSATPSPGSPRRFAREDVVEQTWRIVQPALSQCGPSGSSPVHRYAVGSWGPKQADALLPRGDHWFPPLG